MLPELPSALTNLEGSVERVTYYNPENGYSVLQIRPSTKMSPSDLNTDGLVTIVGNLPELQPGELLRLTGEWTSNPKYGRQFKAHTAIQITPTTLEGVMRYLSSGLIKGVGAKTATKIVRMFGSDTLDVLDNSPRRLYDVPGLKPELVSKIIETWGQQRIIKDVMIFLQGHNITTGLAVKIYKQFGDASIRVVREDPYRLAREVEGVGFRTADKIACEIGIPSDSPARVGAGISYTLEQHLSDGHIFLPREVLIKSASEILNATPEQIDHTITQSELTGQLYLTEVESKGQSYSAVYLPMQYRTERKIAKRMRQMRDEKNSALGDAKKTKWAAFFKRLEKEDQISLTDQQQDAVKAMATHKFSVLTGGPGTGKTTTLRAVIRLLESHELRYALASPTGRAAKRLAEATGRPAQTIHRLLAYSPKEGWGYNEDHPLEVDALVIDEASMLDMMLFNVVLSALPPHAHLLLVGDIDQLPSVGAGDVLRDVIASEAAFVTRLNIIFRQAETSLIVSNAHKINTGELPDLTNKGTDFFIFKVETPEDAANMVVDLVMNRVPTKFGFDRDRDIQVLAPMYKGNIGIEILNQRLQQALNPPGRNAERKIGSAIFRVGDRVMQTRNNYDKGVFNGDIGTIYSIDLDEQAFTIRFDEMLVEYSYQECDDDLTHAFCISTHKSQGSEYPVVVMPVMRQHYMMLQRNLLYTAITRAKKLVVLVGTVNAIQMAISNNEVNSRYTALPFWVKESSRLP
jgi:exodeoxyribonuclease V alpha subunit